MSAVPIDPGVAAALVAALPAGVIVVGPDLTVREANPAAEDLLGDPASRLVGRALSELGWDPADGAQLARTALAPADPVVCAMRTARGERRVVWVQRLAVEAPVVLLVRHRSELGDPLDPRVMRESSFRALVERGPDCVIVHHADRVVYANQRMLEAWGGPPGDLVGRSVLDLIHPDELSFVRARQRALAEGQTIATYVDERLRRHDGSTWIGQVAGVAIDYEGRPSTLVVARDVTEHRHLLARLAQADRMVALGTLAAGVAHEIGNPLTYVLLRLDAAAVRAGELRRALAAVGLDLVPIADELSGHVAAVVDGARRVRSIVSELKVFAHAEADDAPRAVDVKVPLERALTIAAHELKDVRLVRALAPAAPVMASDGKLTQVFLNLVLNAVQATRGVVAPAGGHELRVAVWTEAGQTLIAITDTGAGIGPGDVDRVFDPFFSTKAPGEGVGLGLAITHTIVTSTGGQIRVDSRPGAGATFTVVLPAAPAA